MSGKGCEADGGEDPTHERDEGERTAPRAPECNNRRNDRERSRETERAGETVVGIRVSAVADDSKG